MHEDCLGREALGFIVIVFAVLSIAMWFAGSYARLVRRRAFLASYQWPPGLLDKVARKYPDLSDDDFQRVGEGLKQFFAAYLNSGRKYVAMPSEAADQLWHEFILYTRHYEQFCKQAFGKFLHHTPAVVLSKKRRNDNEGLRRVWAHACKAEGIDPMNATTLPLLFALDRDLEIPGGFIYHPQCEALREKQKQAGDGGGGGPVHCGSDFTSTGYDGSTDGLDDGGGDGGGDGGCGGGGD